MRIIIFYLGSAPIILIALFHSHFWGFLLLPWFVMSYFVHHKIRTRSRNLSDGKRANSGWPW